MTINTLKCVDIQLERGGFTLFEGFNLSLEQGKMLILQGKNGSGKSTLLKLLAGLLRPHIGEIQYNDTNIRDLGHYSRQVAYIGHRLAMHQHLSVEDNLMLWARLYKRTELFDAALSYFGLELYADMTCANLSAGWRQRLALARLILSPANIWLLDEPASHMDEEGVALMQSLIQTRREQGGMVVLSLHGKVDGDGISILNLDSYNGELK